MKYMLKMKITIEGVSNVQIVVVDMGGIRVGVNAHIPKKLNVNVCFNGSQSMAVSC